MHTYVIFHCAFFLFNYFGLLTPSVSYQIKASVFFTVFRSLKIVGSYVGNRSDAVQAVDFAARDKVVTTIDKVLPLESLPTIFDDMSAGKVAGRVVLNL